MRVVLIVLALCGLVRPAMAQERMAFWNLTTSTITNLVMAPAGSSEFGTSAPTTATAAWTMTSACA